MPLQRPIHRFGPARSIICVVVCAQFAQNQAGSLLFHWFENKGNFDDDGDDDDGDDDDDDNVGDGDGNSNNDADNNQLVSGITMRRLLRQLRLGLRARRRGRGGSSTAWHATVAAAVR